ncbi:cob(I)yrinic acid a,c-diamide adenosyltransferase [Deinococcus metallilatus]|uniref:Corrinoid adenosyltransferase n=1 Tax=Deinococcus metallilatus TaxID=1211322 RepID=A0AAJ5F3X8_9DEIO|nr:cob(I)yrinic acid a,c-diamide adenosyltransferase [Deinococcus metallilatus]MBB5297398.1 cob(I)alamin adenosyltransferase [Deinococcus metallilatus]QBY08784.1 cob(I)yrinic acid a,c-diamide adenosyltransferase [Deinococcus metallilatus]RXJ10665.1 cob(I)yrinic acid a,c-diamide adenosyltransferase [Deinococcus metallilatus]TLK26635.1 cob(I)yrinic acid a,c-diamide adenosyltransferase [Deinococcus metallilatus]GMA17048.1 ATP--cob(I)alamin adenosyltransferase [Deinococcus metallilatus]
MKLYTRTGDKGSTGLYGADRVSKAHPRVEAYGTVDELNSVIGLARAHNAQGGQPDTALDADLEYLQNALFDLGADLATRQDSPYAKNLSRIDAEDSAFLEAMIDRYQEHAPPFTGFVHPGGTPTAAALQLARTVARRAEREVIRLAQEEEINPHVQVYLNRVSDLLFVMARAANQQAGVSEQAWTVKKRR